MAKRVFLLGPGSDFTMDQLETVENPKKEKYGLGIVYIVIEQLFL
ncbi:hypothetical protein [Clostridium perfringens]|nr:hypothetical protein [Clostridium perfringens]